MFSILFLFIQITFVEHKDLSFIQHDFDSFEIIDDHRFLLYDKSKAQIIYADTDRSEEKLLQLNTNILQSNIHISRLSDESFIIKIDSDNTFLRYNFYLEKIQEFKVSDDPDYSLFKGISNNRLWILNPISESIIIYDINRQQLISEIDKQNQKFFSLIEPSNIETSSNQIQLNDQANIHIFDQMGYFRTTNSLSNIAVMSLQINGKEFLLDENNQLIYNQETLLTNVKSIGRYKSRLFVLTEKKIYIYEP